ncbi:hypothetical protein ABPG72_005293 [Tetrahymena utriculariae]
MELFRKNFVQLTRRLSYQKSSPYNLCKQQYNSYQLCFKAVKLFSAKNDKEQIKLDQEINSLFNQTELYIQNQETRLINELISNEKYSKAISRCREVLQQNPKPDESRVRYLLAYSLKKEGLLLDSIKEYQNLIKHLELAISLDKQNESLSFLIEASHYELAQLYLQSKDMEKFFNYSEKAIQYNALLANQDLIEHYIAEKQIERAITFLKQQHERVPQNETIIYLLGFLQECKGQLEDAVQSYQKAIDASENQKHPQANLNLGMILKRKGDYEASTCYLLRSVEADPYNYKARFNLGQNLRFLGEGMLGVENLEACLKQQPENPLPFYDLALCYEQIGNMEKCIHYLERNIEAKEVDILSCLRLANIFTVKKDTQKALEYIQKGINSDDFFRENIDCINLLQCLYEKKNAEKVSENGEIFCQNTIPFSQKLAENLYKQMEQQFMDQKLNLDKQKCSMFNFFTQLFLLTNQIDLAIQTEQKLVEFNSNSLQHRVNLASLYRNQKKLDQAINQYKELIKLQPEEANYHYFCGQIQLQSGRVKDAIISYNKAIQLSGENDYCLFELYNCYKLNNQDKEAQQCKSTLLQYFPDFFSEEQQHIQFIESLYKVNQKS